MSEDENKLVLTCPHCAEYILIYKNEINCAIFRHAVFKENYMQISPHMPKEQCDSLIMENKVFGCAKPFKIINSNDNYVAVICEYI